MAKTKKRPAFTRARKAVAGKYQAVKGRVQVFLKRRPHRSFRRTRRRDYARSMGLPGYFAFTNQVFRTIWQGRKLLFGATALYAAVTVVVVGLASQDSFNELRDVISETGSEVIDGGIGKIGEAFLILLATVSGNVNGATTSEAQIYASILGFLFWLTLIWILRSQLADRRIKLRDALYSAGAPIVPTAVVSLVILLQLVPLAVGVIAYSAASSTGLLAGGVEAMLAWLAIGLLSVLSLYWLISTLLALVIVTIPGMYPYQAIKTAGDLVIGRRFRVVLRMLWMLLAALAAWVVVMIPLILIDGWLKDLLPAFNWLPLLPIMALIMASLTLMFGASYIYLLYRKIVDHDAESA